MSEALSGAWRVYVRSTAVLLAVLYAVGVAGHAIASSLPAMIRMTPVFLGLTGVLATVPSVAAGRGRFALWLAGTYAFTFAAEAAGVATGAVFGQYGYGPALGWAWRGVPLVIAFNWATVVNGSVWLAGRLVPAGRGAGRRGAIILLAGGAATAFDFLMEPVAVRLDYWRWAGGAIPLRNYAAWFALAAGAATVHPDVASGSGGSRSDGRLAGFFVLLQAVFFLALRVVWRFQGG